MVAKLWIFMSVFSICIPKLWLSPQQVFAISTHKEFTIQLKWYFLFQRGIKKINEYTNLFSLNYWSVGNSLILSTYEKGGGSLSIKNQQKVMTYE